MGNIARCGGLFQGTREMAGSQLILFLRRVLGGFLRRFLGGLDPEL
jgi:hypothetical protein